MGNEANFYFEKNGKIYVKKKFSVKIFKIMKTAKCILTENKSQIDMVGNDKN